MVRVGWLIDLRFYFALRIFHLDGDVTIAGERAAKFRPMLGAQGLWGGMDLYRLIRRTAPFNRLLRHIRRCGGSRAITKETISACFNWGKFLSFLVKFHWSRKVQIYTRTSCRSAEWSAIKSWLPRIAWGHNKEDEKSASVTRVSDVAPGLFV
jgi:hypothetical protein